MAWDFELRTKPVLQSYCLFLLGDFHHFSWIFGSNERLQTESLIQTSLSNAENIPFLLSNESHGSTEQPNPSCFFGKQIYSAGTMSKQCRPHCRRRRTPAQHSTPVDSSSNSRARFPLRSVSHLFPQVPGTAIKHNLLNL